jgi:glycosyltransferase involved in cell wall biosynthesis
MNILNIGSDNSALRNDSPLQRRIFKYADLVDNYSLIVPKSEKVEIKLNEKIKVFGSGGKRKICQFSNIFFIANKLAKDFDVISVQDQYYLGFIAWLVKVLNKKKLEIQIHGFERFGGLRKCLARFIIPRADAVRVVSERLKKRMTEEFKCKAEMITVVPIYVNVATHNLPAGQAGAKHITNNDNKFIFLTVGRLVEVKNILLQINALAEVTSKFPDTELWIIGQGPLRAELEARSRELCLDKNVRFFGWQADVTEFYRQAGAFLLTSFAEGWPLVIIEAASCELPIIMTDMGSAGEFIINDKNGIVIPQNDKSSLVEAMIKLIPDSDYKKQLLKNLEKSVSALPAEKEILSLYLRSWQVALGKK